MANEYFGTGKTVEDALKKLQKEAQKGGAVIEKMSYLITIKKGRREISGTYHPKYEDALKSALAIAGVELNDLLENLRKYSPRVTLSGESKTGAPAAKGKPSPAAQYKRGPESLTDLF